MGQTVTMNEKRSIANRLASWVLALPDPVLAKVSGMGAPIEFEGRVLNRQLQAMLGLSERLGVDRSIADAATRRAELRRLADVGMPKRTNVHVVDRVAELATEPRPVRVYRRYGNLDAAPAIIYFHGGGWVTGDLDTHDGSCRLIADVTGCVVVAVDYRLAPEHPFPAATDDACAAYRWVHDHAHELGVVADRIGVMGDSAGGTLAAVVAQHFAHATDIAVPAAQCLIYPATNAHMNSPSISSLATGYFLTKTDMDWFRAQYLPDETMWDDVRASPLLATDLSGLAPAVVVTAGFDPLRDEGMAYADALADAGVSVVARCYDDLVHGFFGMGVRPGGMAVATEVALAMGQLMHAPSRLGVRGAESVSP